MRFPFAGELSPTKLGVLFAGLDGLFLASWGVACKWYVTFDLGWSEYISAAVFAGVFHLLLSAFAQRGAVEAKIDFSRQGKWRFLLFAVIGISSFYIGILVYEWDDASVSASSFFRNSSMVFAAVLMWLATKSPRLSTIIVPKKLEWRHGLGLIVFLFGVWCFQDFKATFNAWVWLSFLIGFNRAVTELLMQRFAVEMNQATKEFWLGACILLVSSLLLAAGGSLPKLSAAGWIALLLVGGIIPLMQVVRFSALKRIDEVLAKKAITIASYLLFAMVIGYFAVGDAFSWGKTVGLFFAIGAVMFFDARLYEAVAKNLRRRISKTSSSEQ